MDEVSGFWVFMAVLQTVVLLTIIVGSVLVVNAVRKLNKFLGSQNNDSARKIEAQRKRSEG
jgi:uncharacterized membrane protein